MKSNRLIIGFTLLWVLFPVIMSRAATTYLPAIVEPPGVPREFRAVWIATVENIDWPSRPGLPVEQQKAEMLALLDCAMKLNMNAVVLQVRPACDAFYASKIEPWSFYLTGKMGKAPEPFYDPLAFAVEEAHRRGLELHAWFNPYRAALLSPKSGVPSANHISRLHPNMVVAYGKLLWLDPGEKEVQDYSLRVVMDVVKRYDIDGVHFDDYFYPYKETNAQKQDIEFPDGTSWRKYSLRGKLSRDDWRRENVNSFVQRAYESIKSTKPWVKFGIAPFGIWQPRHPQQIKGFNAYDVLYCDSRKWLMNGWLDYCAPQLYWAIDPPDQSFPVLLKWWQDQNLVHRNLWPGLDTSRVGGKWKAGEIVNQIKIVRDQSGGAPGEIHWGMKTLLHDRGGLGTALDTGVYAEQALVPASPWLERKFPEKPRLKVEDGNNLKWSPVGAEKTGPWVLQTREGGRWRTRILPAETRGETLDGSPEIIVLTEIDRCGVASPPAAMQRAVPTESGKGL